MKTFMKDHENNISEPCNSATHAAGAEVWMISDNTALVGRVRALLQPLTQRLLVFSSEIAAQVHPLTESPHPPRLIILDIDGDVDGGLHLIQCLKQARIQAPIVIMTENFSRDFGAKIIPEHVHYYFSHDFCDQEFLQLVENLWVSKTKVSMTGHDPNQSGTAHQF